MGVCRPDKIPASQTCHFPRREREPCPATQRLGVHGAAAGPQNQEHCLHHRESVDVCKVVCWEQESWGALEQRLWLLMGFRSHCKAHAGSE